MVLEITQEFKLFEDQYNKIVYDALKKTKKNQCLFKNCHNLAINCHWFQRNGILNKIANEGHLYELTPKDIYKWDDCKTTLPDQVVLSEIKKKGMLKAFSNEIFCEFHDSFLFKNLENGFMDLFDYKSQLLLSYRALCAELKKSKDIYDLNLTLKDKFYKLNINYIFKEYLIKCVDVDISREKKIIDDLYIIKELAEREIDCNTYKYEFTCIIIVKKLPIALCTLISSTRSVNPLFLHIIPRENDSFLILGHRKYPALDKSELNYVKSWHEKNPQEIEVECTKILLTKSSYFCMSPVFFENLGYYQKQALAKAHSPQMFRNYPPDFNLFG